MHSGSDPTQVDRQLDVLGDVDLGGRARARYVSRSRNRPGIGEGRREKFTGSMRLGALPGTKIPRIRARTGSGSGTGK